MSKTISIGELADLKFALENKKEELSELKGRLSYLMDELQKTYKCGTVKEAEDLLEQKSKLLTKKKDALDKSVLLLQEEYADLLSVNVY